MEPRTEERGILVLVLRALFPSTVGGHVSIARADVPVSRGSWGHAVAPLAASVTCPYAHLLPRRFAAPIVTLRRTVCKITKCFGSHKRHKYIHIF